MRCQPATSRILALSLLVAHDLAVRAHNRRDWCWAHVLVMPVSRASLAPFLRRVVVQVLARRVRSYCRACCRANMCHRPVLKLHGSAMVVVANAASRCANHRALRVAGSWLQHPRRLLEDICCSRLERPSDPPPGEHLNIMISASSLSNALSRTCLRVSFSRLAACSAP